MCGQDRRAIQISEGACLSPSISLKVPGVETKYEKNPKIQIVVHRPNEHKRMH